MTLYFGLERGPLDSVSPSHAPGSNRSKCSWKPTFVPAGRLWVPERCPARAEIMRIYVGLVRATPDWPVLPGRYVADL